MRLRDETPLDPEVSASLDAIDAVLAGEPVDPRHAELAELALLVAAERSEPNQAFTTVLDEGVRRRFTAPRPAKAHRRRWLWAPTAGLAAAGVIAAVVLVSSGSSGPSRAPLTVTAASSGAATTVRAYSSPAARRPGLTHAAAAPTAVVPGAYRAPSVAAPAARVSPGAARVSSPAAGASQSQSPALQPPSAGRKLLQGGELALSTAPSRIDTVAQEVFDVIGQAHGIVNSSTVTATGGPGGYAQFQLSIPSAALSQTMAALSTLQYAHVASRTDTSQDVTGQYNGDVTRLADARALRTSLLKQLANATTQTQIDSLTAQLHDAEASISSDLATLRGLNNQINYSQVTVTINGGPLPVPTQSGAGGFSLHRAAHDAGRVLTVAAGAALIALAALVPLALVVALGWWALAALRRRRREQALDAI